MFRPRQKLYVSPVFPAVLPEIKSHENGEVSVAYNDESDFRLPDVETTRLRTLLEAGVDLKQVNSKLFGMTETTLQFDNGIEKPKEGVNDDAE